MNYERNIVYLARKIGNITDLVIVRLNDQKVQILMPFSALLVNGAAEHICYLY